MGMGGCYSFIKYFLVFMNFIFFLLSLGIIGLAVWMLVDQTFYVSMAVDSNIYTVSVIMLLVGGILLCLVSFLGCCGALRESRCMLVSFFCILLVIIVAQLAAAIWAYCKSDELEAMIRMNVKSTVQVEYYKVKRLEKIFDTIQQGLQCCGAEYPSDWNESKNIVIGAGLNKDEFYIPQSCCRANIDVQKCDSARHVAVGSVMDYSVNYKEGCANKVIKVVHDNMVIVLITVIVVLIIELIGLIFALILAFTVNSSGYYKR